LQSFLVVSYITGCPTYSLHENRPRETRGTLLVYAGWSCVSEAEASGGPSPLRRASPPISLSASCRARRASHARRLTVASTVLLAELACNRNAARRLGHDRIDASAQKPCPPGGARWLSHVLFLSCWNGMGWGGVHRWQVPRATGSVIQTDETRHLGGKKIANPWRRRCNRVYKERSPISDRRERLTLTPTLNPSLRASVSPNPKPNPNRYVPCRVSRRVTLTP